MNVLNGIQNFLESVNDNWTSIIVIISLVIAITKKALEYFHKSEEEKIDIAKKQIQETILKFITDAEKDYDNQKQTGSIKRAQVITELFLTYPILSKAASQEELIVWIDKTIDEALVTFRQIIANNK